MPPIIGVGTYVPNGQYAFPRSYIRGFGIQIVAGTITQLGNGFVLSNPPSPAVYAVIINDYFYNWSSNGYTLDHVIGESYYSPLGDGSYIPMPFLLQFYNRTDERGSWIVYSPFSSPGGVTWFELPPAPPGYWLVTDW